MLFIQYIFHTTADAAHVEQIECKIAHAQTIKFLAIKLNSVDIKGHCILYSTRSDNSRGNYRSLQINLGDMG